MPTIEDDGKYLTCRAENLAISDSALEDKWRLDVQYQPVVSLRMGETLNPDDIKEGDDVYFECIVRANPKVYKLAWFKDVSNTRVSITISEGTFHGVFAFCCAPSVHQPLYANVIRSPLDNSRAYCSARFFITAQFPFVSVRAFKLHYNCNYSNTGLPSIKFRFYCYGNLYMDFREKN